MKSPNVPEQKTSVRELVEMEVSGKSLAKFEKNEPRLPQRFGFMKGEGGVPEEFDALGAEEIVRMFEGRDA